MENYELFSEEDFITNPQFQDWIFHPDESNTKFWQQFMNNYPDKKPMIDNAKEVLQNISFSQHLPTDEKVESSLNTVLQKIRSENKPANIVEMKPLYKWLSAAAILILLFGGGYFLSSQKKSEPLAKENIEKGLNAQPILPGGDKATLTLSTGQTIVLDSTGNGTVSNEGGVKIIKLGGQLSYRKDDNSTEVLYNIIATPKGGQYQLILADGTKAWLNAASSLRFPTAFIGNERTVELTGEGYFEVAHNAAMPFHVKVSDMDVQVLGTHFNVMAYSNEEAIKTTLLEGKVKVRKASAITMLLPGQQAQASNNGEIKVDKNADVEAAVAWKNGLFQLKGADVKTIGRQIERWYDVEVNYSGNLQSAHLSGDVPRTLNLSQMIKVLETSGIDVKITGRNLLVTPKP